MVRWDNLPTCLSLLHSFHQCLYLKSETFFLRTFAVLQIKLLRVLSQHFARLLQKASHVIRRTSISEEEGCRGTPEKSFIFIFLLQHQGSCDLLIFHTSICVVHQKAVRIYGIIASPKMPLNTNPPVRMRWWGCVMYWRWIFSFWNVSLSLQRHTETFCWSWTGRIYRNSENTFFLVLWFKTCTRRYFIIFISSTSKRICRLSGQEKTAHMHNWQYALTSWP